MHRTITVGCLAAAIGLTAPTVASGQNAFRSTQSANLPTAVMLRGGNMLFEISHRFDTPVSQGASALWGIDGPVNNRLGLTYAAHERLMLSVLRSNYQDNVELSAKFLGVSTSVGPVPLQIAALGGFAWNTEVFETAGATDNELQTYVQVIANVLLGDRVALGVVPTFLRNPRILDVDSETALAVGINGQVYLDDTWSFLGEWIVSETQLETPNDGASFGVEIRTRGHFFKLLVTNQAFMSPTQFLAGSPHDFTDPDDWRFGFNLVRLLPF